MSARSSRLAWTIWALAPALVVAGIVMYFAHRPGSRPGPEASTFVMLGVPSLAYASVGAAITSRLPRNRVGWLFLAIGLTFALTAFSGSYAQAGIVFSPSSLPAARFMAWLFVLAPVVALPIALPLLFLLFPTGRLLSRRWIPAAAASVAGASLLAFGVLARPSLVGSVQLRLEGVAWARGLDGHERAPALGIVLIVGASIAAVASVVVRYRRASGEERQQLRALAYLLGALAATLPFPLLLGWLGFAIVSLVVGLGVLIGIPIAAAISILGYRLYDIELTVKKTVTAGLLVGIISLAYAFIAVLLGSMFGGFDLRYLLPAVVIAVAFQPLRARARRWADRLVYGERATPYEVLSEFTERASGTYSTEDVLPRMVQLVAAGTGATDVRVWLRVGRELRATASLASARERDIVPMPGEELPEFSEDELAYPVRHQGELLGAITVKVPANDPLTPTQEKLLRDLAAQTGLVLRNVGLIEEIRDSRRRIVAAQDERAKALERNIHDGAQQQLVAIAVKLRLAQGLVKKDTDRAQAILAELQAESDDALENLRDLARGIYPPLLADKGLVAALEAQTRKTPLQVRIDADGVGRFPPEIEAAVYFCCLEGLQNAAKHANATGARILLEARDYELAFSVEDEGVGFDVGGEAPRGTGLQNMADRLAALGGALDVRSEPGTGTSVSGRVPVQPPAAAAVQAASSRSGEKTDLGM